MLDLAGSIEEQRHGQGVEGVVKTASDLARYRRLLADVKPKWIVELGTFSGKSACWFADTAQCRVVTVDTHPQVADEQRSHPSVTWIQGNSATLEIAVQVFELIGEDEPVVVVLDSDHSADHVWAELVLYSPLVTPGGYMVVEDGIVRWLPEQLKPRGPYEGSPLDAIEWFLGVHGDEWEVDTDIEDMLPTTQFPSGWLRRR